MVANEVAAVEVAYPAGMYGKRASTRERPQEYALLGRSDGFSNAAVEALVALGRAFRWPGGKTAHAPAFALWPIAGEAGYLAARLLDVGRDDQGRPHLLRIEAIYLPAADLALGDAGAPNLARAARVLSPDAWPQGTVRDGAPIRLTPSGQPTALTRSLAELGRGGSVLVIHEPPPDAGRFATIVDHQGRKLSPARGSLAAHAFSGAKTSAGATSGEDVSEQVSFVEVEGFRDPPSSDTGRASTNRLAATTMRRPWWGARQKLFGLLALGLTVLGFAAGWFAREVSWQWDPAHHRELGARDEVIEALEAERRQAGDDVEWIRQQILQQQKTLADQHDLLDTMLRRLNRLSTSPPSTALPKTPATD